MGFSLAKLKLIRVNYQIITVTPFEQNCSLLCCEETGKAAVIDPGGDLALIEAAVAEQAVTLESILVTHAHLDHVGAVAELAEKYQLPILGPQQADQFWIDALETQSKMFGFPPAKPFLPTRWLEQGDHLSVGQVQLEVIHCPGHTPGHIVFFSPEDQLAFVGDVLFAGSIGRTDFPQGNHSDLLNSIHHKLFPLGDNVRFVPGHGPISTFGQERQHNPYLQR